MTHPYQDDHAGQLLDELLAWLRTKPKIRALATALGTQLQELEESLLDLREERTLDGALGAQLDQLGMLVGEQRGALADEDYRRFIQARILSNLAEGTPDQQIAILRIIAGPLLAGTDIEYRRRGQAAFSLAFERGAALLPGVLTRVASHMLSVAPAGVTIEHVAGEAPAFRFDTGPGFDNGKLGTLIP